MHEEQDLVFKNIFLVFFFRLVTCAALPCVWFGTYTLIMEAFGQNQRRTVMLFKEFFWPLSQLIQILVVYFVRHWTTLHLSMGTICLASLPFFLVLPDSPRWLANNKQKSKVKVVLSKTKRLDFLSNS